MQSDSQLKKLLLMGRMGAGKTSMHSIIFANYTAKDTKNIGFTVDITESKVNFMGNLTLDIWDCAGQPSLMKNYLNQQKHTVFANVAVMLFVFDVTSVETEEDMKIYKACLENLKAYSKSAQVFVLIHKMDTIPEEKRREVFEAQRAVILDTPGVNERDVFGTSIWNNTLYQAWSHIVQMLVPNISLIKESLKQVNEICDSSEVVLFEKHSFLVIAYDSKLQDSVEYERVSTAIKQFKLSCNQIGARMKSMMMKNQSFTGYIQEFTEDTYILMVFNDTTIQQGAIELNVKSARKYFQFWNTDESGNVSKTIKS